MVRGVSWTSRDLTTKKKTKRRKVSGIIRYGPDRKTKRRPQAAFFNVVRYGAKSPPEDKP